MKKLIPCLVILLAVLGARLTQAGREAQTVSHSASKLPKAAVCDPEGDDDDDDDNDGQG